MGISQKIRDRKTRISTTVVPRYVSVRAHHLDCVLFISKIGKRAPPSFLPPLLHQVRSTGIYTAEGSSSTCSSSFPPPALQRSNSKVLFFFSFLLLFIPSLSLFFSLTCFLTFPERWLPGLLPRLYKSHSYIRNIIRSFHSPYNHPERKNFDSFIAPVNVITRSEEYFGFLNKKKNFIAFSIS